MNNANANEWMNEWMNEWIDTSKNKVKCLFNSTWTRGYIANSVHTFVQTCYSDVSSWTFLPIILRSWVVTCSISLLYSSTTWLVTYRPLTPSAPISVHYKPDDKLLYQETVVTCARHLKDKTRMIPSRFLWGI